jgi:hypothetical protein
LTRTSTGGCSGNPQSQEQWRSRLPRWTYRLEKKLFTNRTEVTSELIEDTLENKTDEKNEREEEEHRSLCRRRTDFGETPSTCRPSRTTRA